MSFTKLLQVVAHGALDARQVAKANEPAEGDRSRSNGRGRGQRGPVRRKPSTAGCTPCAANAYLEKTRKDISRRYG